MLMFKRINGMNNCWPCQPDYCLERKLREATADLVSITKEQILNMIKHDADFDKHCCFEF